ncbi:hypothetical protein PHET_02379 [Paragonimus heterotremus]|uniref:C-type lectin domain-containing protein n=1 Tax=Paragonimus heterotremus TaxID=100268 RepID=A0A8J4T4E8_9TREM|nr:hypothetical protein PHET_02379 [Paragonimus heterotremus]
MILLKSSILHACPPDIVDCGNNICTIALSGPFTYCDAHKVCGQEGLKRGSRYFMVGRHMNQVFATWAFLTTAHSGIHSLLNARNSSTIGWQTNEPGYWFVSLNDSEVPWAPQQPSGNYEQVAVITFNGLRTEAQNLQNRSVICEQSIVPIPELTVPTQFKMNWPIILESNVMLGQLSVGCFEKFIAPSRLSCALK